MEFDRNGLEVLSRSECLGLLERATLGRIGIHSGALPTILPVNFLATERGIVIRSVVGSKLDAALEHAVVAFEVDQLEHRYHAGWSVVVTGVARPLVDAADVAWAQSLPLAHWVPDPGDRFICISMDLVSGRRIWVPTAGERSPVLPFRRGLLASARDLRT